MLSSSTETTEAEAWESKVAWKSELTSEWDSWGVKGGLDYDSSNSWFGPRPLLRALWGRLSNKSRLLCWGPVHRCHQQVPCDESGRGRGVWGGEGSSLINFRSRNEQMGP